MSLGCKETRSEQRHAYFTSVEFASRSEKGEELLIGTAINLSNSGLCIYSYVPLREGQEIIIRNAYPVKNRIYVVRWTIKLLDDFFAVGLKRKNEAG